MAYIGLDPTTHGERTAAPKGNPLPPGMYTGTITRTQLKNTKDNTGMFLEVEFDISSPSEYGNRKFWDRFNIQNKSATATKIGKEQLSDLVRAAGLPVLNEETDLQGKTVNFVLRIQESKDPQYPDPKNECDKYWPVGTTQAQHDEWRKGGRKGAAPVVGAPAQAATPSAAKPWARK